MTVQVDFYVLGGVEAAGKDYYACRIANKGYGRGLKVYLRTGDPEHSRRLDKMLWTFSQGSFVPHAVCGGETHNQDPDSDHDADHDAGHDINRYPVLIGHGDAPPHCAGLLISLGWEVPADYARFERVAELISAEAADKASGRERFRFYREQGIEPQTHKVS